MSDATPTSQLDYIERTVDVVAAYVSNNSLPSAELPSLIASIHSALNSIGSGPAAPVADTVERPTPAQIRKSIRPDGLISFIDHSVGRILDKLATLGLADNTVVVFTADHGDYMGDHQLLLKGPIHYRSITQVPFIWRDPQGRMAGRSAAFAGTIDLAPTMLSLAGIHPPEWYHGRALAGRYEAEPRAYLHGGCGRMDERHDVMRSTRDTRSRTSLAASSMFRESWNSIEIAERPSRDCELSRLMPSMPAIWSSMIWVICVSITEAEALRMREYYTRLLMTEQQLREAGAGLFSLRAMTATADAKS